jgi:hypothetical protein
MPDSGCSFIARSEIEGDNSIASLHFASAGEFVPSRLTTAVLIRLSCTGLLRSLWGILANCMYAYLPMHRGLARQHHRRGSL